ncbi:hypothetical protein [Candidatus Magnetominusculus dajiuhuensis]|uniref:hypothetical protein n=1 Tax=Candidatus Magnetominusculus dajiuhuensis TaxID=3137712 RepID=UPI003B439DBC
MYGNLWALFIISLRALWRGWKKSGIKKTLEDVRMLRRLFPAKAIKIKKSGALVISESGNDMAAEIHGKEITVYGSITIKNCVILLRDMTFNVEKVGQKILSDGSLWIENTLFLGSMGHLSNLNIVSGGIVQGEISKVSMVYIRDGRYNGTISEIEKWLHISNSRGIVRGSVGRIGEVLYLDAGEFITDTLPSIEGGYAVLKEGKIMGTDGTPWPLEAIMGSIAPLTEDHEIFLFGSGGNVLLGAGAAHVLCKEGTDPYSRYKTENIISSNRFYRLIDGKIREVTLKSAPNQQIGAHANKFYSFVRLEIVDKTQ